MRIFSLCFLLFINAMSIGLVFPIFASLFMQSYEPLFNPQTTLATQTFCYSMILAIPTFCMILGAPFLGRLSDRQGRKKILLIGLIGIGISFLLSAWAIFQGSLLLLFISRALAGFMDGSESIAQAMIIDVSIEEEKSKNMSYATFAGTIGFIVGPVLGGFLAEPTLMGQLHFEMPFMVSLLLTIINAITLYCFLPKEDSNAKPENEPFWYLLKKGFSFCFDKRIRGFSGLLFFVHWCLACFFQLSTLLLAEKFQYSSGQIGLFTTFLGACFSGGILLVIRYLLNKWRYLTLLRGGIVFIACSMISAIILCQSDLLAWVSVVPMMLGIAMMYNVLLVLISNSVSAVEQGEAMGSGTALKALAWLISGLTITCFYPNLHFLLLFMLLVAMSAFALTYRVAGHPQVV